MLADRLRRHAELAEAGDDFCDMLEPRLQQEDVARANLIRKLANAPRLLRPAEQLLDLLELAPRSLPAAPRPGPKPGESVKLSAR
jgi:hypothetical protein